MPNALGAKTSARARFDNDGTFDYFRREQSFPDTPEYCGSVGHTQRRLTESQPFFGSGERASIRDH